MKLTTPNVLSILGYLLMVAGIVSLMVNLGLFSPHPGVIVIQIAPVIFMIWARQTFGPRGFHANPLRRTPRPGSIFSPCPLLDIVIIKKIQTSLNTAWIGLKGAFHQFEENL